MKNAYLSGSEQHLVRERTGISEPEAAHNIYRDDPLLVVRKELAKSKG
jgi:hypothetical protein